MLHRRFSLLILGLALGLALWGAGCIFSPDPGEQRPPPPEEIPPPTSPENLIRALQVIYNDKVRSATERWQPYQDRLSPNFIFFFQQADYETVGRESWGRDEEIQAHRNMFEAQESQDIYSLELRIEHLPPADVTGDTAKAGWKEVFATNVYLRLLTTPQDGFEVNGGQAEFETAPGSGRWWIGEWTDLPEP